MHSSVNYYRLIIGAAQEFKLNLVPDNGFTKGQNNQNIFEIPKINVLIL